MVNDWSKKGKAGGPEVGDWQHNGMLRLAWDNAGALRVAQARQRTAIDRNLRSVVSLCRSIDRERTAEISGNISAIAAAYLHRLNRNGGL